MHRPWSGGQWGACHCPAHRPGGPRTATPAASPRQQTARAGAPGPGAQNNRTHLYDLIVSADPSTPLPACSGTEGLPCGPGPPGKAPSPGLELGCVTSHPACLCLRAPRCRFHRKHSCLDRLCSCVPFPRVILGESVCISVHKHTHSGKSGRFHLAVLKQVHVFFRCGNWHPVRGSPTTTCPAPPRP